MLQTEKIEMFKAMLENEPTITDSVAIVCLADAGDAILRRMYPFGYDDEREVPVRYHMLQCKLAVRYYTRRGGEGESFHIEQGTHRSYDTVNDEDLLMEVTPIAKVV